MTGQTDGQSDRQALDCFIHRALPGSANNSVFLATICSLRLVFIIDNSTNLLLINMVKISVTLFSLFLSLTPWHTLLERSHVHNRMPEC